MGVCGAVTEESLRVLTLCPLHVYTCPVRISSPALSTCVSYQGSVCVHVLTASICCVKWGGFGGGSHARPLAGLPPRRAEEATGPTEGP